MKALTIWQPWATLIVRGLKLYEFRTWPSPASLEGQRIVIHTGKRACQGEEIEELVDNPDRLAGSTGLIDETRLAEARDLLVAVRDGKIVLPLSAALGTAMLGRPRKALDIFAGSIDPADIDPDMWGWPLTEPIADATPTPSAGARGLWDWSPAPAVQTGHTCHADRCYAQVPPKMLMCARHWRMVPKPLKDDVWREYRRGQELDKRPSDAYLAAARAAIAAVAGIEGQRLL